MGGQQEVIPPQLALLFAKYGKQIGIGLLVLLVMFGMWLAVKYHESVVKDNEQLSARVAESDLARKVDAASIDSQKKVIEQWKYAHDRLQATLQAQKDAQERARREKVKINDTFRDHDLARLAIAKPGLVEDALNAGTQRMHRLLVCASAGSDCDDNGHPRPAGTPRSSSTDAAGTGVLQLARSGSRLLEGSGRGVLLRRPEGVRIRRAEPRRDLAFHQGSRLAAQLLQGEQ